MQDIDFDEIDRAVTSASGATSPVVDVTAPVLPPAPSAEPAVAATSVAPGVPPAARRSAGRFMDVVHPSSDMRASAPVAERPVQAPVAAPTPEPTAAPVQSNTESWPDPLDFHGFVDDSAEKPAETPVVAQPEAPARVAAPSANDMHPPLETPFIRNAVVEKRPLGAFSEANPAPTVPEPVIPDLSIEEPTPEPAALEPAVEPAIDLQLDAVENPAPAPTPVVEAPAGPVSIAQQYQEQPSTIDQPSGAIFDTESYHQPLVHVAAKKSGAFVIIWIAALILVGAGAGAAVYFFVLPLL